MKSSNDVTELLFWLLQSSSENDNDEALVRYAIHFLRSHRFSMQSCPAEAIRKATVEDNQQMTARQLDESIVQLLPYMRSLVLPDVYYLPTQIYEREALMPSQRWRSSLAFGLVFR
jgi:hypothetical protein